MKREFENELIVTIIERGFSELVVEASREAGAKGGTVIFGRGTNINSSVFGMQIQPEKEIILTITDKASKNKIMTLISERAKEKHQNNIICISLPVSDVLHSKSVDSEKVTH